MGCVSAFGKNVEELFDTFEQNTDIFENKKITFRDEIFPQIGISKSINDTYFKKFIDPSKLRRLDRVTKLALSSARQAILNSNTKITQENCERIGIIYGTSTGPISTIKKISEQIIKNGIGSLEPTLFPNSVLNAAPRQISIANNIKGVNSTIVSGNTSFMNAFIYATVLLKNNQADQIIVVCSDEWDETNSAAYGKLDMLSKEKGLPFTKNSNGLLLTEGSVAIMLERKEYANSRKANMLADVLGYFSKSSNPGLCNLENNSQSLKAEFNNILADCNYEIEYYASTSSFGKITDIQDLELLNTSLKNAVVRSVPRVVGMPFSATSGLAILSCLYAMSENNLPNMGGYLDVDDIYKPLFSRKVSSDIRGSATVAYSHGGAYAGVVLGKV